MSRRFEAVPNFSEGRDAAKVKAIADAAASVPGVSLLDVESNADHNRCVISLVGEGAPLSDALFAMMKVATGLIDLNHHQGEHPRMGATDVVPFIPLGDATPAEAVALAEALGARVARELQIPVYLYGLAARRPERQDLAVVRKGGFEGIREAIRTDPTRAPDFGPTQVHPTAGAVAIGARPVLIAYNAYLSSPDVAVAKRIAHSVRARDGGLPEVKALGFETHHPDRAQVSMNLTDYHRTPIHQALEAVRREAEKNGTQVEESEIVGLVPEDALFDAAEFYLKLHHFDRATILERKVRSAAGATPTGWLAGGLGDFIQGLAARTPTPGGGSAAAAAGAFGIALGQMVVRFAAKPDALPPDLVAAVDELDGLRETLSRGVDGDSRAQAESRAAVREAIEVPLATARAARAGRTRLDRLAERLPRALESDLLTARALLEAAVTGALANAMINLPDAEAAGEDVAGFRAEIERLRPVAS